MDAAGNFKWSRTFSTPGPRIYHDVLFTQNYVVLMDYPVGVQLTPPFLGIHKKQSSRLILIPRDGKSKEIIFELDPCYVLHGINSFERDGKIYLSVSKFDDPFKFLLDFTPNGVSTSQ